MSDWLILRTSGRHTLPLAASLNDGGFEAWTPATNVRLRRGNKRVEVLAPLLPTFVFAEAGRLLDLLGLSDAPACQHPDFSVFHYLDRIPIIADADLDALRHSEARRMRRKQERKTFSAGDFVKVTEGPFAGMSGIVERGGGKYALVMFDRMAVNVATFLLHPGERKAA